MVFISYHRGTQQCSDLAHRLAKLLQERGWKYFIDDESIQCGEEWAKLINEKLFSCSVAVVILSQKAIDVSDWMRHEVSIFVARRHARKGLKILPVALDFEASSLQPAPYPWCELHGYQFIHAKDEPDVAAKIADNVGASEGGPVATDLDAYRTLCRDLSSKLVLGSVDVPKLVDDAGLQLPMSRRDSISVHQVAAMLAAWPDRGALLSALSANGSEEAARAVMCGAHGSRISPRDAFDWALWGRHRWSVRRFLLVAATLVVATCALASGLLVLAFRAGELVNAWAPVRAFGVSAVVLGSLIMALRPIALRLRNWVLQRTTA